RSGPRLAYVEGPEAAQVRRTRLDRLRAARGASGTPASQPARDLPGTQDRATRLAADVGGRVVETALRPIVVVESTQAIAPGFDGLRELPEPVDPSAPLELLDTQTTGLGTGNGTLPFLVGVGTWAGE